jgi:hypothetical protein
MPFPTTKSIEMPILQELVAVGGKDDLRFLYQRLPAYFPQLTNREISEIQKNQLLKWRKLVQRAGKELSDKGYLERKRGFWKITPRGFELVEAESISFDLTQVENIALNHTDIQKMLVEIGNILGFYTEAEFEFYDVVWREIPQAARLSHVFEVQSKGNIDSAFAKLKRAFEAQRSKIFLIISSEKDFKRAEKSLSIEFQEIKSHLTVLSFAQINKVHQNTKSIRDILSNFLES